MTELYKKASTDHSDKTVKDLIWLIFDTSSAVESDSSWTLGGNVLFGRALGGLEKPGFATLVGQHSGTLVPTLIC